MLGATDDLYHKNLYAYCDSNPISRMDKEGDMWELALVGGGALAAEAGVSLSAVGGAILAGLGAITPVGWVLIATIAVVATAYVGYNTFQLAKRRKRNTGRPELKKQGRENLEKKKDENWQQRSGKRPRSQPRPHHPSKKGHRRY